MDANAKQCVTPLVVALLIGAVEHYLTPRMLSSELKT